ncbi:MAG: hypothetical protein ACK5Y2_05825 [Bdellovibrionales bacterium]
MTEDIMKRFFFTVAYLVGSAILIHFVMATDPGFRGNWLYDLTGQVVWLVMLILKIAICGGGIWIVIHLVAATQRLIAEVRNESEEQEQRRLANERNAREQAVYTAQVRAKESADTERQEKAKRDDEEWRRRVEFERTGPRDEKAAIEKALSEIKFGGFE